MIQITKSQPAPACLVDEKLKKSGTYDCEGVRSRLKSDFFNKCYICEEKNISSIVIEHFIAHRGDIDLKFDWNNLFFACGHCNGAKSDKYDSQNPILNCTNPNHRILEWIRFEVSLYPKTPVVIQSISPNPITSVRNTIELLNTVYAGNTFNQKLESNNIRKKLRDEMLNLLRALQDFYDEDLSDSEKNQKKEVLRHLLSPKSAFTAFKHWLIKDNPRYMQDLGDLL